MKINLSTTFKTLTGDTAVNQDGSVVTLRTVMAVSLSMTRCGLEPTKAWKLAQDIQAQEGDEIEIPVEVAANVKDAIKAHNWWVYIIAQSENAIEGV